MNIKVQSIGSLLAASSLATLALVVESAAPAADAVLVAARRAADVPRQLTRAAATRTIRRQLGLTLESRHPNRGACQARWLSVEHTGMRRPTLQ